MLTPEVGPEGLQPPSPQAEENASLHRNFRARDVTVFDKPESRRARIDRLSQREKRPHGSAERAQDRGLNPGPYGWPQGARYFFRRHDCPVGYVCALPACAAQQSFPAVPVGNQNGGRSQTFGPLREPAPDFGRHLFNRTVDTQAIPGRDQNRRAFQRVSHDYPAATLGGRAPLLSSCTPACSMIVSMKPSDAFERLLSRL